MKFDLNLIIKKIIWLMTVALLCSFIVFENDKYISIILSVITFSIFLLDCIDNGYKVKFKFGIFHVWGFLFSIFCLLSSLWAINLEAAISKGLTIIQILICMSILYNFYCKDDNYKNLLSIVEYAGYFSAVYTISFYGIDFIKKNLLVASRLDNEFANVNNIGMICTISIFVFTYDAIYQRRFNIVKIVLILLEVIVIAATASRKAFLGVILGIICLFISKNHSQNVLKIILKSTMIIIALIVSFSLISQFQIFDGLNKRIEGLLALFGGNATMDNSTWLRQQFIKIGLEQFLETPLLGIGIDNARLLLLQHFGYTTYLHNNYVELLASGGIVGTTLFYSIYIYLLSILKKKWRYYGSEAVAVVVLIFIQLAMDFGSVSYYSKITYFYIMTFCVIVKYGYIDNNKEKIDENKEIY